MTTTIKIRHFSSAGIQYTEIDTNEILNFGNQCNPIYTKKGTFKKWEKRYYITLKNGETIFRVCENSFVEVKEIMKDKITDKSYYTQSMMKYSSRCAHERKATAWHYQIQ